MFRLLTPFLVFAAALSVGYAQAGPQPVDITSQELDIAQASGLATFSGNVVVTQGSFTLAAPKVVADYSGAGSTGSDIRSITASGGVTITRTGAGGVAEKATGSTAVYTPASQQIVLTGAVTLTRGPSMLEGDRLVYNMATGNARVTNGAGPVRARFVPAAR